MSDDLTSFLASWQTDGRGLGAAPPDPAQSLAPAYGRPQPMVDSDAVPLAPGGFQGPTGPAGPSPTGPHGIAGNVTGSVGPRGTGGIQGLRGIAGTVGPTGLATGGAGRQGNRGVHGITGPKDSIIQVFRKSGEAVKSGEATNIAFACTEASRPWLFHFLRFPGDWHPVYLAVPKEFVAALVPGSLFVWSIVASKPCRARASLELDHGLQVESSFPGIVALAGINRYLPDWHLPRMTEPQRERSRTFWSQQHI